MDGVFEVAVMEITNQALLTGAVSVVSIFLKEIGMQGSVLTFLSFIITAIGFVVMEAKQPGGQVITINKQLARLGVDIVSWIAAMTVYMGLVASMGLMNGGTQDELQSIATSNKLAYFAITYLCSYVILATIRVVTNLIVLIYAIVRFVRGM